MQSTWKYSVYTVAEDLLDLIALDSPALNIDPFPLLSQVCVLSLAIPLFHSIKVHCNVIKQITVGRYQTHLRVSAHKASTITMITDRENTRLGSNKDINLLAYLLHLQQHTGVNLQAWTWPNRPIKL